MSYMNNSFLSLFLPVLIVVCANTMYNVCTKSTPAEVNPFITLFFTYVVAAIVTVILFFAFGNPADMMGEISNVNWTSIVLGISIVGLETGYILMFRAGWKISNASIVANICLAISLIFVGYIIYKENIDLKQILGIIVCMVGLILITN